MAILESCCGCSLAISSAVLGVYLLVAYSIAFALELWWILEFPTSPLIPAYLLCLGYFILLMFSALLLHGLSVKKTTFLLIWLFMMGILLGPEAGLVLYLSIHHWKVTSIYGLVEITCWACRLIVNSIGLLCVQSLYSLWREEKSVLLSLETLKTSSPSKPERRHLSSLAFRGIKNAGYEHTDVCLRERQEKPEVDYYGCFPSLQTELILKDEDYDGNYVDERYAEGSAFSEFNASSFDPTVIDARLENMPYLTVRKKFSKPSEIKELISNSRSVIQKTRSLIDFRDAGFFGDEKEEKHPNEHSLDSPATLREPKENHDKPESITNSLDRKIIKNKNLKILKRLSPLLCRKPVEVNVYQINPPKNPSSWDLDCRLNKVYSNRGKYAFDEKLKKVVFYPPETFINSRKFRNRMDSYGSSQSRSSVDTDSEDIRHISDVAL